MGNRLAAMDGFRSKELSPVCRQGGMWTGRVVLLFRVSVEFGNEQISNDDGLRSDHLGLVDGRHHARRAAR